MATEEERNDAIDKCLGSFGDEDDDDGEDDITL